MVQLEKEEQNVRRVTHLGSPNTRILAILIYSGPRPLIHNDEA